MFNPDWISSERGVVTNICIEAIFLVSYSKLIVTICFFTEVYSLLFPLTRAVTGYNTSRTVLKPLLPTNSSKQDKNTMQYNFWSNWYTSSHTEQRMSFAN